MIGEDSSILLACKHIVESMEFLRDGETFFFVDGTSELQPLKVSERKAIDGIDQRQSYGVPSARIVSQRQPTTVDWHLSRHRVTWIRQCEPA